MLLGGTTKSGLSYGPVFAVCCCWLAAALLLSAKAALMPPIAAIIEMAKVAVRSIEEMRMIFSLVGASGRKWSLFLPLPTATSVDLFLTNPRPSQSRGSADQSKEQLRPATDGKAMRVAEVVVVVYAVASV